MLSNKKPFKIWYLLKVLAQLKSSNDNIRLMMVLAMVKHVNDIKLLADYCRAKNINVKFVIGPFFPAYTVKGLDVLKQKVEAATGYPVYDYSYSIKDNNSFSDYLHANLKGGEEIVNIMVKDGVLPVANKHVAGK